MRQAEIYSDSVLAGVLTETDEGTYRFRYDDAFLADDKQTAISLSFPKSGKEFASETLFPFFYNMLAEGANKAYQCRTLKSTKRMRSDYCWRRHIPTPLAP